ncbi:MAG: hypothetical protein ACHQ50_17165, partial [Fimbriimonadales bacterium]
HHDEPCARVGLGRRSAFPLALSRAVPTRAGMGIRPVVRILRGYDEELQVVYQRAKVQVANVASAFASDATIPLTTYGGKLLPRDVALVCRWTWMCPISPAKSSPDIHADSAGYRVIAGAFEKLLATSPGRTKAENRL